MQVVAVEFCGELKQIVRRGSAPLGEGRCGRFAVLQARVRMWEPARLRSLSLSGLSFVHPPPSLSYACSLTQPALLKQSKS
jgi:hypothetical protein